MNVRILRARSYLHPKCTGCRYQSTDAHCLETPGKTQHNGRLGEQYAQLIRQVRKSNSSATKVLEAYSSYTFKALSSESDSRFRGTYSPFFVPGPHNQALQIRYSNPKFFEAFKSQPGPADRLIWHFSVMNARSLSNVVYKANNKRTKLIFYKAMREQGLQPDGTPIPPAKQEDLKRITRFKQHGVIILAKRASSFRDGVQVTSDIDSPLPTAHEKQSYAIKGTLKIRVDENIPNVQQEVLMKDARKIVRSLMKRARQWSESPPPALDVSAYGRTGERRDRRVVSKE